MVCCLEIRKRDKFSEALKHLLTLRSGWEYFVPVPGCNRRNRQFRRLGLSRAYHSDLGLFRGLGEMNDL